MQLHSASPACMHQSHLAQDLAASSGAVEPAGGWEVVSAATARLRVGESGRQGGMGAWHVRHGSHVCEHGMSGVGVGASGGGSGSASPGRAWIVCQWLTSNLLRSAFCYHVFFCYHTLDVLRATCACFCRYYISSRGVGAVRLHTDGSVLGCLMGQVPRPLELVGSATWPWR